MESPMQTPSLLPVLHRASAIVGIALIASFWSATILVELFGDLEAIRFVKTAIVFALPVLILCLATAGLTGRRLAQGWKSPVARAKRMRTAMTAANAFLILIPAAIFLALKARAGELDTAFYAVQAAELIAGATNLVLLILNARAGSRLKRRSAT
jgi:hypothetical protein